MLEWLHALRLRSAKRALAGHPPPTVPTAAIIPPAVPGSVGDAAMISATASHLRRTGFAEVDLLYGGDWPLDAEVDRRTPSDGFFYGASIKQHAALTRELARYSHLYFIGADVIDGAYNPGSVRRRLELLAQASASGRSATVLGASYNDTPEASTRDALRALPGDVRICGRDPVSRVRLEQQLQRPIVQVADLAFLLEPKPDHQDAVPILAWIRSRRAAGDAVVAVNGNYLQAAKHPELSRALTELIGGLAERGSVLLVPHDSRTAEPDAVLLSRAAARLPEALQAKTRMLLTTSPGAIKAALGEVDLLITGRLHAQILAMGAGTPVIGLAYQGKFEGLLKLFDFDDPDLLSTPQAFVADPARVLDAAARVLARRDTLHRQIVARMPAILDLSRANFA